MPTSEELEKRILADHDTLTRLETKFDAFTQEIRQSNAELMKTGSDHEARIRVLESDSDRLKTQIKTVGWFAGIVSGTVSFAATLIALFTGIVR